MSVSRLPFSAQPPAQGLYDPAAEHDACGVAFVATLTGQASGEIVAMGLTALLNLDHRGASGAEPDSGDGAGILLQVPDRFLRRVIDAELPPAGEYAVGMAFLPDDDDVARATQARIEQIAREEGLDVVAWREVPTDPSSLGQTARSVMPRFAQLLVRSAGEPLSGMDLERRAFCLRKRAEHETDAYFPSLSSRTLVYKGMLTTHQLGAFFPDLSDPDMESALALVHSRFSTNTFPSWPLAHPYRFIAHNGEINTVKGNVNWIRARHKAITSAGLGDDLHKLWPLIYPGQSDTASFDNCLELLVMAGYPLSHAMMMMVPEAWEGNAAMEQEKRDFYEQNRDLFGRYHGDYFTYEEVSQIIEKRLREDAYDKLIRDILCESENRQ